MFAEKLQNVEHHVVAFYLGPFYDMSALRNCKLMQTYTGKTMSEQDQAELRLAHARLKLEHSDYDSAIEAMRAQGCNPLQIQRMKKKKLAVKDKLTRVEDQLLPDIIA